MSPELTGTPPSGSLVRTSGWILLLGSPALIYMAVLYSSAINIPTGDDYPALFNFLARWENLARGGHGGIGLLFEQFYSHRIPFTRLAIIAQTALQGHCDLRLLIAFASGGWLLLLASLLWSRWSMRRGMLCLLPVSLLLMQPQGQTNLLVATGSPGHAWTILLAFWAFHFARSASLFRQGCAVALAASATLCTANGLLVIPLVALGGFFRRDWWRGLAWLIIGAVAVGWYLRGYSVAAQPFAHQALSFRSLAENAIVMTGAIVKLGTMSLSAVVLVGLILLVAAGVTCWRDWRVEQGLGHGAFMLFLLLSIAMISYARMGWSADYMLQDRYRFYGLLIVTSLYLRHISEVVPSHRTALVATCVAVALCFNFFSYAQTYPDMLFTRRWAEATAMNLAFDRYLPLSSAPDEAASAGQTLKIATLEGKLHPPRLLRPEDIAFIRAQSKSTSVTAAAGWRCVISDAASGYVLVPVVNPPPGPAPDFGVIFQNGNPLILPVIVQRARFAEILSRRSFLSDRYVFVLPRNAYSPGPCTLHAITRLGNGTITARWSAALTCP